MEAGHSVLFVPAYRLLQELLFSKRDLDLPRELRKLDNFDLLLLYERYERRSLGVTSSLAFSQWEHIFANPTATATAIDRVVHHSVILEFDVPSYRTNAAQQRGQSEEVNRQNWLTPNRQILLTRDRPSGRRARNRDATSPPSVWTPSTERLPRYWRGRRRS